MHVLYMLFLAVVIAMNGYYVYAITDYYIIYYYYTLDKHVMLGLYRIHLFLRNHLHKT